MIKVLRIGTYPTSEFKSMGKNSYMISGMESVFTTFVTPEYPGKVFPPKKNTDVISIPFLIQPSPKGAYRIIHEFKRIFWIIKFSFEALFILERTQPKIVHIHSPMFFLIAIYARFKQVRCYITYHGNEHTFIYSNYLIGTLFNWVFHKTFSLSSQIHQYKEKFSSYENNFILIDNAVDLEVFCDEQRPREKFILAVGRLEEQKDYPTLIEGFSKFHEIKPDYKLLIVGTGQLQDQLHQLTKDLAIEDSVKFMGKVNHDELPGIYNNSEIFVLSSFWEGFPKVLLEAMACKCKVICTKVDSAPRVLGENYEYFMDINSPDDLKSKLISITDSNFNFREFYNKKLTKFTWNRIRETMEKEYNS